MKFTVLYGTESGNSELIAQDLGQKLQEEHEATVADLQDFEPEQFSAEQFYIIICSTHGEGELPNTALPFYEKFESFEADLSGVNYAMFGLGDTFYEETYSQGSEHIDRRLTELGATRIGEYGRHDASSWDLPSDVALEWLPAIVEEAASLTPAGGTQ
ncbi:flavodoxin domain-containing protein [Gulosibacter molinativorax]|uniref:Nitric oxide synthase n=1 Tax=Gulosibacter molinativorax TaxID=256821 RepID=A0ABT7C4F5_9MICO|nr:flavodoxin domain-containing protein [Gulosibacter molinativorax]MDJ1370085.1 nitric oxide synthase [Gulosibacter molinativorax]QUY63722.1 Cindoxin [Gulosibacter molinativorax]